LLAFKNTVWLQSSFKRISLPSSIFNKRHSALAAKESAGKAENGSSSAADSATHDAAHHN
jgi:hypothetical protein